MSRERAGAGTAEWARSGVMALTGHPDGPPLVPPGTAAAFADRISARLAAATADSTHPLRVDGASLLAERAAFTGHHRRGRVSAGGAGRLLPTADGWAAVSCARPDDPPLLGALVGAALPDDPWPTVAAWVRTHTGAELAERAALLGLAAAPVDPSPPRPLPAPGRPRSPAGLLVVDFSALWAGPLCAQLLGLAGAHVVKVETPQRLDGARRGSPGFFRLLHAGHRSVLLDPTTAGGRRAMSALVDAADIVIEASRPRALAGFGLDAEASARQGTIWVSVTADGRDSPRVGFGDDVAAGAGLVARDADGQPVFCGDALADPLTGLFAAGLALSAPVDGRGRLFDVAMSQVVSATLAPAQDSPTRDTPTPGRPAPDTRASARPTRDTPAPDRPAPDLGAPGSSAGDAVSPGPPAPGSPARTAHRDGDGWAVDTSDGPVPVAAPRRRTVTGHAPEPGRHTDEVLRELRIPSP
ncbi:CoA transferase [Streptomyces sp. NPDC002755]|uniref:CoA transferase n=1 Tax=Streptomyces sp. NPDC002884 TaxID=3154544 RepID=UPI003328614D